MILKLVFCAIVVKSKTSFFLDGMGLLKLAEICLEPVPRPSLPQSTSAARASEAAPARSRGRHATLVARPGSSRAPWSESSQGAAAGAQRASAQHGANFGRPEHPIQTAARSHPHRALFLAAPNVQPIWKLAPNTLAAPNLHQRRLATLPCGLYRDAGKSMAEPACGTERP